MKKIFLIPIFSFAFLFAFGQDYGTSIKLPLAFSQYYLNPHVMNPALTGFHGKYRLGLNYRSHWSDFPGSPKSFAAHYNGPAAERVGLGALVSAESFGVEERFRGQLSYAYNFGAEDYKMSLGLSTDYSQFSLDNDAITNELYDPNDPLVNDALDGRRYFAATIGFYSEYKDQFFFGLSLPQVILTRIDEGDGDDETSFNYIASLGTWIKTPDYDMVIEPSLYLKKIGNAPLHVDINVLARFLEDRLYGGLSTSFGAGNRLGFLVGARIANFRFYYGYDVSYQEFQDHNNGTHEVTLTFDLFSQFTDDNEKNDQMNKMDDGDNGNKKDFDY